MRLSAAPALSTCILGLVGVSAHVQEELALSTLPMIRGDAVWVGAGEHTSSPAGAAS